ncbi:hypothetical protein MIR68_006950 [Amoeboaphelidium protococcarum]|nr:hypothetical protein MIR68_006950 [Amoeboaphelidium protococcarum]
MSEVEKKTIKIVCACNQNLQQDDIVKLCMPFGEIARVHLPATHGQDASITNVQQSNFYLVQFESARDAGAAVANLDQSELNEQTINVQLV